MFFSFFFYKIKDIIIYSKVNGCQRSNSNEAYIWTALTKMENNSKINLQINLSVYVNKQSVCNSYCHLRDEGPSELLLGIHRVAREIITDILWSVNASMKSKRNS